MSDPRITDEVVEDAAKAHWESDEAPGLFRPSGRWSELIEIDPYKAGVYRRAARAILEAAVPLLAPQPAVDREALRREMRKALDSYVERGPAGYYEHTDAVLALLNGGAS